MGGGVGGGSLGGGSGGGGGDGDGGDRWGSGGGAGDQDGFQGMSLLASAAVAHPLMDLAASIDSKRMLVILCCLVLPVLGCFLHNQRTDKYFWIGLVLSFLPPFGIIYALAYTQGRLRF